MARGEDAALLAAQESGDTGGVVTPTGRLSIARRIEPDRPRLPFSPGQLARVDEAIALSTRTTGLEFAVYVGGLGEDSRAQAEDMHATLGARAAEGVLIAVSPGERKFEIVTGDEAYRRIPDRSCQLAAMSMVASFKEDELIDGLIGGLRMLSDAAGTRAEARSAH
ncbi:DUF5130 family protein [Saccharopolyspora cebuensis]|uniref:DUF5130 family protein n=1 Tax=Saccharopolyspora cebuensis TaxID=418759 RepID=UPI0033745B35